VLFVHAVQYSAAIGTLDRRRRIRFRNLLFVDVALAIQCWQRQSQTSIALVVVGEFPETLSTIVGVTVVVLE
jgi:hypothetical protein